MLFSFSESAHQRACAWKQKERQSKIDSLPPVYTQPLSLSEIKIQSLSISQLVSKCRSGLISPASIALTFAKNTLRAHAATNCITDIMFDEALLTPSVTNWGPGVDADTGAGDATRDRLLMGVPVSIKDTIDIAGHDTTIGFSSNVDRPVRRSSAIVRLLQDAGALILSKTTVPTGLLAIETVSDLFGYTSNPYNNKFSAGASTGGGGALVACGGSKIEIGTDLAGSVRIPAHFCGIWGLKASAGRFPLWGSVSSVAGLEGVPIIASPMAGTLSDLHEFIKAVVYAKPWEYDHTCIPLPWQPVDLSDVGRKLKWGIMWDDGIIPPTPACRRALSMVVTALRKQGHEVVDFIPPDILEGSRIGYQLLFSDGGDQLQKSLRPDEVVSAAARAILGLLNLPRILKRLLAFLSRLRDPLVAELYRIMNRKTVLEERNIVAQRDEYRAQWHEKLTDEGMDFILTVPYALPAIEKGASEKTTLMSAGYTFLSSLLDYTAGVLPVTFVDQALDALPDDFSSSSQYKGFSSIAKSAYSVYDAKKMHGLPLGVQIIGKRLEEEKVLEGMKVIEAALKEQGIIFSGKVAV